MVSGKIFFRYKSLVYFYCDITMPRPYVSEFYTLTVVFKTSPLCLNCMIMGA